MNDGFFMKDLSAILREIRELYDSGNNIVITNSKLDFDDKKVKITIPKSGDKKLLLDMAKNNVKELRMKYNLSRDFRDNKMDILLSIKSKMGLTRTPRVIECFDNSNLQGTAPVSSCVVFRDGEPRRDEYKCYNVETVLGPDDCKTMKEIVYRRYYKSDNIPDLIIVDGGKGQLNAAVSVLKDLGLFGKVDICGLAKHFEEFFFYGRRESIRLEYNSPELKLLQKIRNEAHNFAIKSHRELRKRFFLQ